MSPVFAGGRLRLLGFALLAATFVAGALAGAAVDRVLNADVPGPAERAERRAGDRRSYVIDRVEMSDAQRDEIDAILKRRSTRMRSVWQEVAPRLDAITDSARLEIMEALTPEQRAEYERRLEEREKEREKARAARRQDAPADGG